MKLQITIDGKTYEVDVELVEEDAPDEVAQTPQPLAPPEPPPARIHAANGDANADPKICRSPVNGLVIKVNVQPGQAVAADELVMVLEAMKMESNVTAPEAGTVKSVHVTPGDSVKTNQVLVEFE